MSRLRRYFVCNIFHRRWWFVRYDGWLFEHYECCECNRTWAYSRYLPGMIPPPPPPKPEQPPAEQGDRDG